MSSTGPDRASRDPSAPARRPHFEHAAQPVLLAGPLAKTPDETALVDDDGRLSWRELADRVRGWMGLFDERGIGVGDRITCRAHNSSAVFEILLAALHTGVTVVPVSWHLTADEVGYIVGDSGSRLLVCDEAGREVAQRVRADMSCPVVDAATVSPGAGGEEPVPQTVGATMMYTSGTTGRPKGVVNNLFRTGAPFDSVVRMMRYSQASLGVPRDGVKLLCGPWYHSSQLFFALLSLLSGSRLIVHRRFDAARVLTDVNKHGVTHAHLVPTHFVRLLGLPDPARAAFDPSGLQLVWHGGGPCAETVKHRMIDWWGPVLTEYYGATEGGALTLIDAQDWLAHPGSVGRALPPNEIVVVDDEGRPVDPGTTGTVCVRRAGGSRFRYHNDDDKTRRAHLDPATFTVGDLGHLDDEGYLFLSGRGSEVIVSGAVNVYPAEVEAVLRESPDLVDVSVFAVPDPEFGELVAAVVKGAPAGPGAVDDTDEDVLVRLDGHARQTLAGYKVPRRWFVVDQVPREASGKVRRQVLEGLLADAKEISMPTRTAL